MINSLICGDINTHRNRTSFSTLIWSKTETIPKSEAVLVNYEDLL